MKSFFLLVATALTMVQASIQEIPLVKPVDEPGADFFQLCLEGDHWKLDELLEQHPHWANATSSDDDGDACLHKAAKGNNEGATQVLLAKGADPNVRTAGKGTGGLRMPPISWNLYFQHYNIIRMLLEAGANVNLDFDLQYELDGPTTVITPMDIIKKFYGNDGDEVKVAVEDLLVEYGAKTYEELHGKKHDMSTGDGEEL